MTCLTECCPFDSLFLLLETYPHGEVTARESVTSKVKDYYRKKEMELTLRLRNGEKTFTERENDYSGLDDKIKELCGKIEGNKDIIVKLNKNSVDQTAKMEQKERVATKELNKAEAKVAKIDEKMERRNLEFLRRIARAENNKD